MRAVLSAYEGSGESLVADKEFLKFLSHVRGRLPVDFERQGLLNAVNRLVKVRRVSANQHYFSRLRIDGRVVTYDAPQDRLLALALAWLWPLDDSTASSLALSKPNLQLRGRPTTVQDLGDSVVFVPRGSTDTDTLATSVESPYAALEDVRALSSTNPSLALAPSPRLIICCSSSHNYRAFNRLIFCKP